MSQIEQMAPRSGDIIGEDGKIYNKVSLYRDAGAVAEAVSKVNKDNYSPYSGRIIGEDGSVYNEVELMQNLPGGGSGKTRNVTYAELKALRDGGELIPSQEYRITDYVTTTVQEETLSAGHAFDIIVVADSASVLNENARAIQHEGDTYFANSNLAAWRLKYCLDNDTNKFAWADSTNGKGVIYELEDEFNNKCGYDFKNVQFKLKINGTSYPTGYSFDEEDFQYWFTFSTLKNGILSDFSLHANTCGNIVDVYVYKNSKILNNIAMYSTSFIQNNRFDRNCHGMTPSIGPLVNTHFGYGCFNIFGYGFETCEIGAQCNNLLFSQSIENCVFGWGCRYIYAWDNFIRNLFGEYCYRIVFKDIAQSINLAKYTSFCVFSVNTSDFSSDITLYNENISIYFNGDHGENPVYNVNFYGSEDNYEADLELRAKNTSDQPIPISIDYKFVLQGRTVTGTEEWTLEANSGSWQVKHISAPVTNDEEESGIFTCVCKATYKQGLAEVIYLGSKEY